MDFHCVNTTHGLVPDSDRDYDKKKKLVIGQVYKVKVTKARNYQFHKKYFALLDCAWEYLPEKVEEMFKHSKDHFRKTIEMAAGHCDTIFSIERNEYVDVPKSISFAEMDEIEFQQHYENVKTVLFNSFLRNIDETEFMKALSNF